MEKLRDSLGKLGWPIETMTDRDIQKELYRRWFACQPPDEMHAEGPVNVASARGIFVAMASEGNLDALCWSSTATDEELPILEPQEQEVFARTSQPIRRPPCERRRSPRKPARELVCWSHEDAPWLESTGWLVDRSDHGLAFISESRHAPQVGARIHPTVHTRKQGLVQVGSATVVRADPLNPELTLVCAQLEEPASRPDLV